MPTMDNFGRMVFSPGSSRLSLIFLRPFGSHRFARTFLLRLQDGKIKEIREYMDTELVKTIFG